MSDIAILYISNYLYRTWEKCLFVIQRTPARSATRRVVVDSGPLLALFNGADRWHRPVMTWLQANPEALLDTTWPVLTEVCALLARRVGNAMLRHWIFRVGGSVAASSWTT